MPEDPAPWTDIAGKAFDDAKRLFKEGDYAGALERHEWFHEHALEFKSCYYGVRLSYALSHWRKLADVYPPAMTALLAIRDRDSERLLAGTASPQLLHDVASINDAVEQTAATIELIRRLEAAHPALVHESFVFVDRLCLDADSALFRRFCSDPVKFYRLQREGYFRSAVFLTERGKADSEAMSRSRSELSQLAKKLAEAYSDDSEAVSKIARLESMIDDELSRRLL